MAAPVGAEEVQAVEADMQAGREREVVPRVAAVQVGVKVEPGVQGAREVPEVAKAVPEVPGEPEVAQAARATPVAVGVAEAAHRPRCTRITTTIL